MILEGMTLSSGLSFTPPPMVVPPIDLLVVAGGAAGAANGGNYTVGGGGAGGLIWATGLTFYNGTYTVTVGAGGAGVNGAGGRQGNSGGSSSVTGTSVSRVTTSGDGGRYGSGGIQGSADGVPGYAGYYANSGGGGGAGGAATSKDGGPARLISELNGITGYNNTGYFAGGGADIMVLGALLQEAAEIFGLTHQVVQLLIQAAVALRPDGTRPLLVLEKVVQVLL